jgi:iron complex outermembrane receptor protein
MPRKRCAIAISAALLAPAFTAAAQPGQEDLKRLTIEELMRIDVTTAARRPEPIASTTSAVSVITGEDIRRSGVTTIADALELADGVHVSRLNNGTWRISTRGFNGSTPNKLLVMIDGRTVYSPLFAGVFWNMVDYPLEDVERIEVIRGPGAVLWGANAVNGVVNIITRHSRDTQGALVSVSSGNEHPALLDARYGGTLGRGTWRGYGKVAIRDQQVLASGLPSGDGIRRGQAGFRIDSGTNATAWLLKGDVLHSTEDLPDREDADFGDISLQGRWSRTLADGSRVDVLSYYRREHRRVPSQLTHDIDVFDLDVQHATSLGTRHRVVWGGGFRVNRDDTEGSDVLRFEPERRTYAVSSLFAQDEIALVPGRLYATAGLKFEHNAFSGGELQPNLRARLEMPYRQVLWGAVSRAIRRPTRLDDDALVLGANGIVLVRGTHGFEAEALTAFELGYRVQPVDAFSVDATVFRHAFDDLRSQDLPEGGGLPITIGNTLEGDSTGVEVGVNVQPAPRWRTHIGYTFLRSEVRGQPGSRDVSGGSAESNDPNHLFQLRSSLDLPYALELDATLRGVGELPDPRVPAYAELSLRLGWRAAPRLDLWVVGHDLLHASHPEAGPDLPARVHFERAVRVGVTMRFDR